MMNRMVFIGEFDDEDLELINEKLRVRYRGHVPEEYMAELYDGVLTVQVGPPEFIEEVVLTLDDYWIAIESNSFSIVSDVVKIMDDNFEEDYDLREAILEEDDCDGDCENCGS